MKKLFAFFLLLILNTIVFGQVLTPKQMGPFKVNAKLSEVEKISKQKIKFTEQQIENYDYDRIFTINGVEYTISFNDEYDKNGRPIGKIIDFVSSANPKLKTAEGIGIGSTKNDIINAYSFSDITIFYTSGEDGIRSKTDCIISVFYLDEPDEGTYTFELKDLKITKITVSNFGAWN